MTPANEALLEQLRIALDPPPDPRAIADAQAAREHAAVSMTVLADAADAKQLRDRVRALERQLAEAEEDARIHKADAITARYEHGALKHEAGGLAVELCAWRDWARETYNHLAPEDERYDDAQWAALTHEQVRNNLDAQIGLLKSTDESPPEVLTVPRLAAVFREYGGRLHIFRDIAETLETPAA